MFRIRRLFDAVEPSEHETVARVQAILREQFPGVPEAEVAALPSMLRDPAAHGFRTILLVAEDQHRIRGLAVVLHFPDVAFAYLDFVSAVKGGTGGGVGGALYATVRELARDLGAEVLLFECLPDDPALCRDPVVRRQNAARLKFYERFGAFPILGTAYETPLTEGGDNPPYLVADRLDRDAPLPAPMMRERVRAILERKYSDLCPPAYNRMVLASFAQDPVRLRPPRYLPAQKAATPSDRPSGTPPIALFVSEKHQIHHVRERGYVEAPVRISAILDAIVPTGLFERLPSRRFPIRHVREVHDTDFVTFLSRVCKNVPPSKSVYPYVFPLRNAARPPRELPVRAGYYCIDTFTPLNRNAYDAALHAVDCALSAAEVVAGGRRLAYALVRPPAHHAERRAFGGFCYFNSTAIAAQFLAKGGRVAVLDIDYHHGNGTQSIFYERADVLTVSLHGHPNIAYPYFAGFSDERGAGAGAGFNLNIPLPEELDGAAYAGALAKALRRIEAFRPAFLVVALGLDTAAGDPTGSWGLRAEDFERNGAMIGKLGLPTLVIQEGGYRVRTLGSNARRFFVGLARTALRVDGDRPV